MPLLTLTPTLMTVNIKDFYSNTPTIKRYKYMRIIPVKDIGLKHLQEAIGWDPPLLCLSS
jgi:hypothetical protein